jgi:hypothetical protein
VLLAKRQRRHDTVGTPPARQRSSASSSRGRT